MNNCSFDPSSGNIGYPGSDESCEIRHSVKGVTMTWTRSSGVRSITKIAVAGVLIGIPATALTIPAYAAPAGAPTVLPAPLPADPPTNAPAPPPPAPAPVQPNYGYTDDWWGYGGDAGAGGGGGGG